MKKTSVMMVLRLFGILVLASVCVNGETVEVNPQGEATPVKCEECNCEQSIQVSLAAAEQQCLKRLEAHELAVTAPLKEQLASAQSKVIEKDTLIKQMQLQRETTETEHNNAVMQHRRNAIQAAEHTRQVENQYTECNQMLQTTAQNEQSLKLESSQSIELLQKELNDVKAQKLIADSTVLKLQKELESHKTNLDQTRETLSNKLNEETTKLKTELDQLHSQKSEAQNLAQKLKKELDTHKEDLSKSKEVFTRELHSEKQKFKETHHKYFTSQRDLLKASEKLAEFHKNATSTYVNVTLIQIDMTIGAIKAADWTVDKTNKACDFIAPYWAQFVQEVVTPNKKLVLKQYKEHVQPLVVKVKGEAADLYDEHLKDHVNYLKDHVDQIIVYTKKHILPRLEPAQHYLELAFQVCGTFVQHVSVSAVQFLELSDFDKTSSVYQHLLSSFKYASGHGTEVLWAFLKYLFYFWMLRIFVFRKRTKPTAAPKQNNTNGVNGRAPSAGKSKKKFSVRATNTAAGKQGSNGNHKHKKNGKHH